MSGGMTILFTGLPSSGKSTIAREVGEQLGHADRPNQLLDGDVVRQDLCTDLGFSAADRGTNLQRIGFVAAMLASHGVVALVPVIAPYRADRSMLRDRHASHGLPYLEVHVDAPVEVCAQRDVKGLYRKRELGEIEGLTGIDDPYELPEQPDIRLITDHETTADSVLRILRLIGKASVSIASEDPRSPACTRTA